MPLCVLFSHRPSYRQAAISSYNFPLSRFEQALLSLFCIYILCLLWHLVHLLVPLLC